MARLQTKRGTNLTETNRQKRKHLQHVLGHRADAARDPVVPDEDAHRFSHVELVRRGVAHRADPAGRHPRLGLVIRFSGLAYLGAGNGVGHRSQMGGYHNFSAKSASIFFYIDTGHRGLR